MTPDGLAVLAFGDQAAFRAWLAAHHADAPGLWLKIAKKATGIPTVTYAQALDVALCFGWIDGQRRSFDEAWFVQRFTPRRARSAWSQVNREHVARLEAAGSMTDAGRAEVLRARADGRWDRAYASPSRATVPEDLRAALDAAPGAAAGFAALSGADRFSILHGVQDAKRPETRAHRIAAAVARCAAG